MKDIPQGHVQDDTTLASLPRFRWTNVIRKLSGAAPFFTFLYNTLGRRDHYVSRRVFWIKTLVCIGFLSSVLISWKLWTYDRIYPPTPLTTLMPSPAVADLLALTLLATLVCTLLTSRNSRLWLSITVGIVAILWCFDQSRLQPWAWHYTLTLVALTAVPWRTITTTNSEQHVLHALRLSVIAMYFYSGLQKMNFVFVGEVFPWMASPILTHIPGITFEHTLAIALMIPILEMGIAVCLLIPRTRPVGILGAAAMLTYVLWTLGPFGHAWNPVVWPWNIVLFSIVLLLFWKRPEVTVQDIIIPRSAVQLLIVVAFCILPLLSFFDKADSYLSFALYSGNVERANLVFTESAFASLPTALQIHARNIDDTITISLLNWSFSELNVPSYPEERIFRSVAKRICEDYSAEGTTLVLRGKQHREQSTEPTKLSCTDL